MASEYFPITFMGEYVDIAIDGGALKVREVYDVFFTPTKNFERLRLFCLSTHNLLENGRLTAQTVPAPGIGHADDAKLYVRQFGQECSYDAEHGGLFSIKVAVAEAGGRVELRRFTGRALAPRPIVPEPIASDGPSLDFMETHGTLFELTLKDLIAHEKYALRIVVCPVRLLNLPMRLPIRGRLPWRPISGWVQHLSIMDPRTCRHDYLELLREAQNHPEIAACAAHIQAVLANDAKFTLPVDFHRISVVAPADCVLNVENAGGLCETRPPTAIELPERLTDESAQTSMVMEWMSGRSAYPHDDLESSTRLVWEYLDRWAHGNAKSKEEITTAIEGVYRNVSLIVDALTNRGLIKEAVTATGRYLPVRVDRRRQEQTILAVVTYRETIEEFTWRGYRCRYSISYESIPPEGSSGVEPERGARPRYHFEESGEAEVTIIEGEVRTKDGTVDIGERVRTDAPDAPSPSAFTSWRLFSIACGVAAVFLATIIMLLPSAKWQAIVAGLAAIGAAVSVFMLKMDPAYYYRRLLSRVIFAGLLIGGVGFSFDAFAARHESTSIDFHWEGAVSGWFYVAWTMVIAVLVWADLKQRR